MGEQKKKKRDYSFWGCRRAPIKCGELVEEMKQVKELPEVGKYVVIHECVIYEETNETGRIITSYRPDSNYFDVWGNPAAYKVVSYSKGIGAALDKDNRIYLERVCRSGYVAKASVPAVDVAIGAIFLKEVERAEDAIALRSRYYGYKQSIVRETTEELMRNAIKRKQIKACAAG